MNYFSRNLVTRGWNAHVADIGPVQAQQILDTSNHGNRRLRPAAVEKYAMTMKRGDWKLTPEPLVISNTGRLLNGQHRLSAVVAAKTTCQFFIVDGVDDDVFPSIDRGVSRTASDALSLDKKLVEAATILARYLGGARRIDDAMISRAADIIASTHASLVEGAAAQTKVFSSAPLRAAACLRILSGPHGDYVRETYKAFVNGHITDLPPNPLNFVGSVARGQLAVRGNAGQVETFVRAWDVFDYDKRENSRITIRDQSGRLAEMRKAFERLSAPVKLAA